MLQPQRLVEDPVPVAFAAKYAGTIVMADGSISYKRFLTEVLNPSDARVLQVKKESRFGAVFKAMAY